MCWKTSIQTRIGFSRANKAGTHTEISDIIHPDSKHALFFFGPAALACFKARINKPELLFPPPGEKGRFSNSPRQKNSTTPSSAVLFPFREISDSLAQQADRDKKSRSSQSLHRSPVRPMPGDHPVGHDPLEGGVVCYHWHAPRRTTRAAASPTARAC